MTNVPHSALTGADLHESKGVASAGVDTLFIADGAGSGAFKKLPATAISGLANPFGASLLHVREEQAIGVSSVSTAAVNNWVPVTLNTVKTNEVTGSSLSSSQIILPAGSYFVEAIIPYYFKIDFSLSPKISVRLQNLTTATTLQSSQPRVFGLVGLATIYHIDQGTVGLRGRFTLAGTSVVELQQYRVALTLDRPAAFGQGTEVYAEVLIWKTA